jgi:hypothetical protein
VGERTFELRTLKDGRWLTEYRSYSQDDALFHARELVGSRHYLEVRVVAEVFDEIGGTYREKILFKHRSPNAPDQRAKKSEPEFRSQPPRMPSSPPLWARLWQWLTH